MIKAIETRYAGCRFRSRLEARWAVFFDHLGVEWEHEPDGFETSAGPGYAYDDRHAAFARQIGDPLIVTEGLPRDYHSQWSGAPLVIHYNLIELPPEPLVLYSDGCGRIHSYHEKGPSRCPRVDAAYAAARSARFGD